VEIQVPGVGTYYAERSPADLDRLAQAVLDQNKFLRAKNLAQDRTNSSKQLYESYDDFCEDALHCLVGHDGNKSPMSQDEELMIGWAVYNHARYPKDFLLFGSAEDRLNSRIAEEYGVTSEYFQGGLLNPERWSLFVNDCWILGGIKAGLPFMTVTDFATHTRQVFDSGHRSGSLTRT
jgi:hypothetical protein